MREELGPVVQDALPERTPCADDAVEHAIRSLQAIEDEISAPGLARLDPDERRDLFRAMADLVLERSGSADSPGESRFRAALDAALGRRSRRKARRFVEETSAEAIVSVDPLVWGEALRALAAALAVDRSEGDLDGVLRALLTLEADAGHDPSLDGAELATLAGSSETARRLLTCVADRLCERLEQNR